MTDEGKEFTINSVVRAERKLLLWIFNIRRATSDKNSLLYDRYVVKLPFTNIGLTSIKQRGNFWAPLEGFCGTKANPFGVFLYHGSYEAMA